MSVSNGRCVLVVCAESGCEEQHWTPLSHLKRRGHGRFCLEHRKLGAPVKADAITRNHAYTKPTLLYKQALRLRVNLLYGNACVCCNVAEDLQIDHVSGDGKEHRLRTGMKPGSRSWYEFLIAEGYQPDRYQLLCPPCNSSKGRGFNCLIHNNKYLGPKATPFNFGLSPDESQVFLQIANNSWGALIPISDWADLVFKLSDDLLGKEDSVSSEAFKLMFHAAEPLLKTLIRLGWDIKAGEDT